MLVKEFLQMLRDPRMRLVVFGMPLIQMVIFAFALTTDVTKIKTAVLDLDHTPSTRELIQRFTAGDYFEIISRLRSPSDMAGLLNRGKVQVILHFPPGFEARLKSGNTARLQLLADGTDSNTTSIILGYANQIVTRYAQAKGRERLLALNPEIKTGRVEIETRAWFNPNLESKYYFVPALIALMLMVFSVMLTSIGIVREKEIGTIEQVMVTPIRRLEFILGKTIPYVMTGYITMTLMLAMAMLIFGVRIQGNWLLLYVLTGIYLVSNLGLALLISVSARTQQQALLTAFFVLMPAVLLSGFMFPIKNMPETVQYATFLNPMRWYLEILRGVVQKGVGVETLWPSILALSVLALCFMSTAVARFKKTMS